MVLRIISWNSNGHNKDKISPIHTLNFDILCIQETHTEIDIKYENHNTYCANYTTNSRGVATIINKKIHVIENICDEQGRYVITKIKINKKLINIINVYFPSDNLNNKKQFCEELFSILLNQKCTNNNLMVGDFNLQPTQLITTINKSSLKQFNLQLIKKANNSKKYTYHKKEIKTNIDHMLVSADLSPLINDTFVISKEISDHYPIENRLMVEFDHYINTKVKIEPNFIKNEVHSSQLFNIITKNKCWLQLKMELFQYFVDNHKHTDELQIKQQLHKAETKEDIADALAKYQQLRVKRKQQYNEDANKPSKVNTNIINKNKKKSIKIQALKKNNKIYTKNDDLINIASDFYANLYSKQCDDTHMSQFRVKRLKGNHNFQDITTDEIEAQITKMKTSSSGNDLIITSIYKKYKSVISTKLEILFNRILNDEITDSELQQFNISRLVIIHKKGDTTDLANYRPISVTNIDYRIFTAIILNRLHEQGIINQLIDNTNTYKKQINFISNVINVNLMITKKIKNYFFSVDFKKAFDSIEHSYLFKVLDECGLDSKLVNVIKKIYATSFFKVEINGIPSKKIKVERGIKQGDALSIMLFPLVLQPLLTRVSSLEAGYTATAHADDCMFALSDKQNLLKAIRFTKEFTKVSGLAMNVSKSMIINRIDNNETHICGIKVVTQLNYLGFTIHRKYGVLNTIDTEINKMINRLNIINCFYFRKKIMFLKSYVISVLYYKMQIIKISKAQVTSINKLIKWFLNNKNNENDKYDPSKLYHTTTKLERFMALSVDFGYNLPDIEIINDTAMAKIYFNVLKNKYKNTQLLFRELVNINIKNNNPHCTISPLFIDIKNTSIIDNVYLSGFYELMNKKKLRLEYQPNTNELVTVIKQDYSNDFKATFDKSKIKNNEHIIVLNKEGTLLRYQGEKQLCYGKRNSGIYLASDNDINIKIKLKDINNAQFKRIIANYTFNIDESINVTAYYNIQPKLANHLANFLFKLVHKKCFFPTQDGNCSWCQEPNKPNHFINCDAFIDHVKVNCNFVNNYSFDLLPLLHKDQPLVFDVIILQFIWVIFINSITQLHEQTNYQHIEYLFTSIKKQRTTSKILNYDLQNDAQQSIINYTLISKLF